GQRSLCGQREEGEGAVEAGRTRGDQVRPSLEQYGGSSKDRRRASRGVSRTDRHAPCPREGSAEGCPVPLASVRGHAETAAVLVRAKVVEARPTAGCYGDAG